MENVGLLVSSFHSTGASATALPSIASVTFESLAVTRYSPGFSHLPANVTVLCTFTLVVGFPFFAASPAASGMTTSIATRNVVTKFHPRRVICSSSVIEFARCTYLSRPGPAREKRNSRMLTIGKPSQALDSNDGEPTLIARSQTFSAKSPPSACRGTASIAYLTDRCLIRAQQSDREVRASSEGEPSLLSCLLLMNLISSARSKFLVPRIAWFARPSMKSRL